MLRPCPSSVILIRGCHPWMRFLHPWMIFAHPYGWNCHLSDSAYVLQSFGVILFKIGYLCKRNVTDVIPISGWTNLIHAWKWHPWKSSIDGGTSPMDESVISGSHPWMEKPHPWMTSTDEDDRWQTWTEQFFVCFFQPFQYWSFFSNFHYL